MIVAIYTDINLARNNLPPIQTLSKELQLEIFDHLGPVESTCFGVTCKQFYASHWAKHGAVALDTPSMIITPSLVKWLATIDWAAGTVDTTTAYSLGMLLAKAPGHTCEYQTGRYWKPYGPGG